jgi:crotonobetainyl-CoA:carnitine CoA-transferase CaiB-like acyl-CoA transferase
MTTSPLPLHGTLVLDFSTLLPGPLASLMLAEAGAEVIKIERPGKGDEMRREPADFAMLNRGKRSIAIDLKQEGAVARLRPLIERADVVLEQFRPGVMERLGLGYEQLRAINPRIIYCSINGYGSTGPDALKAGHDLTYAADAGLLMQAGTADGEPVMPATMVGDIGGGTYPAVINILLALLRRNQSGQGERIEISMFENIFPFLYPAFASAYGRGHWPMPNDALETGALPRYNLYRTRDGRFVAAAPDEEKFWQNFCEAIGLAETYVDDRRDPDATRRAVAARIAQRDAAEWEGIFEGRDVACAIVRSFEEAMHSPQVQALNLLGRRVRFEAADLPALPVPIATALRSSAETRPAPALGGDNDLLDQ